MTTSSGSRQGEVFTAKSIAEALRLAAEHFSVSVDDLEYDVLRDSTRSILGIVKTGEVTLRVSAPVRPTAASMLPAEVEDKDEDTDFDSDDECGDADEYDDDGEYDDDDGDEYDDADDYGDDEDEDDLDDFDEADEDDEDADEGDDEEEEYDLRRNPPELEDLAGDVVATLLDKMGVLAAVEVVDHGGQIDDDSGDVSPLMLNLVGDDLGVLIGRRGETLRDLQFIARLIISRKLKVWPNMVLDVEGYKARRVKHLEALAHRMADQVRRTGQRVTLEPMPAHERRIVHISLRDDADVYTESVGQDDKRKVQILPK